jgi:uncharacterized membrane protein
MKLTLKQTLPYIFLVAGVVGAIASFALTYDKIQLLQNSSYNPGCNLSPILSCGSVMKTDQASVLGVPNSIFGLMAFSMLALLGVVLLAGASFKRWFWLVVNAAALGGFVFFLYLYFQAVFRIHAICPYCFAVWLVVPPVLWYTTLYNIREGNLKLGLLKPSVKAWLLRHHGDIMLAWYVVFFGILMQRFWYYWQTLV